MSQQTTQSVIQQLQNNFQEVLRTADRMCPDGRISYEELVYYIKCASAPCWIDDCTARQIATQVFQQLDKNHDCFLTIDEVQNQCQTICNQCQEYGFIRFKVIAALQSCFEQVMQQADKCCRDGKLTLDELIDYIRCSFCQIDYYNARAIACEIFSQLDKDRNGVISIEDIRGCGCITQPEVTCRVIPSVDEVINKLRSQFCQILAQVDCNWDRKLNYSELVQYLTQAPMSLPLGAAENIARQIFQRLDIDCDRGNLTANEVLGQMPYIGPQVIYCRQ